MTELSGVTFDGRPVRALPGQTVAAVLLTAGMTSWRETRVNGRPRGVFCGIGACFDCLVVVNGTPDVRACQRLVEAGDRIESQPGAVLPARCAGGPDPATAHEIVDARDRVVVVGAGPAGMAAALSSAAAGVPVLMVDAAPSAGGQYFRGATRSGDRWRERIAREPLIEHLAEASVWAIEAAGERHRLRIQVGPADAPGRRMMTVDTRCLVLATGAYDRTVPFPGWELPGVYTAGAAQALAKGQNVAIGKRVLLAGTGPFLLPVAESLLHLGVRPLAVLDANRLAAIARGWAGDPIVAAGKLREAARYAVGLARHRVPMRYGHAVIEANGTDRVEVVTVARLDREWRPVPGSERHIEVDAVCVGFGFTAQVELAISARCRIERGPDGGPAVVVDADQQTTVPGVFAAGELTGVAGSDVAIVEGYVAGAAAAARVSGEVPQPVARKEVARGKRFAEALARAYPVRDGWRTWSRDDTLVCRCEEVTRGALARAVGERAALGVRAVKLTSRVGLGWCQGRVCARTVETLAAGDAGVPGATWETGAGARRPIAVPVRLRDLAATRNPEEDL